MIDRAPLLGALGTVATISLEQINTLVGIVAGLLTIAYLVRQHLNFNRPKK